LQCQAVGFLQIEIPQPVKVGIGPALMIAASSLSLLSVVLA